MSLRFFHHPGFAAPLGNHVMPMRKFALVADELRAFPQIEIVAPEPVTVTDLLRVHTPDYVSAIQTGEPRDLAESQKFPWSPALYPSVLLTNGGVLAAARTALEKGISAVLASGFHHSCADHGEGFCTFNGLIVALEALQKEGLIKTAATLDLDLHYGNGTASLTATRPWLRALSIYGNDYWNNEYYRDVTTRHHEDGPNHRSVPIVPSGSSDSPQLQEILATNLLWLLEEKPDIVLFQAGADPLKGDPYSPLELNHADLFLRDRTVFEFFHKAGIPLAWTLAGGYTPDVQQVVDVHVNTARACCEVYCLS